MRVLRWMLIGVIVMAAAKADSNTDDGMPETPTEVVERILPIEPVWAGHPVRFTLLTKPPHQYVAYYDAERRMTVAQRTLDSDAWTFVRLPERIGWDSHNYVTMALDTNGDLHVSGNMHVVPLVYFRTTRPYDATTLERVRNMVGPEREERVTYPVFLRGPNGELVFKYRDGVSGSGDEIYNVYDAETRSWWRLIDEPLADGRGEMNAYFVGPQLGPDGYFHLTWVWRDTPDAATNHDLSYARSRDLVHWETSTGQPQPLPMTLSNSEIIDPVPAGGGLLNGQHRIGFDSLNRPIVTYHKYDADGNLQIYAARPKDGAWEIVQISDWQGYRWRFGGGGSIPVEVHFGAVRRAGEGKLALDFSYPRGSGTWILDEATLRVLETRPRRSSLPASLFDVRSDFPGMAVRFAYDSGSSGVRGVRYLLRWETLGPNRDRPRPEPHPEPSMLELIELRRAEAR